MIVSEQKPIKELMELLKKSRKVFLVGCGDCAAACRSGGLEDLPLFAEKLEAEGISVAGWFVPQQTCMAPRTKIELREVETLIEGVDAVLSFSCGAGTQTLSNILPNKLIFPAVNTVFLASTLRAGHFLQHCSMCGDCVLGVTGGLCPQTLCAKSLMNGPCSGSIDGKCETYRDRDCVWHNIYNTIKERGELDSFQIRLPMKDFSKLNTQSEKMVQPMRTKKGGGKK
jgi:ferredoxin